MDVNQAAIVAALRAAGVAVFDCSALGGGFPDLACYSRVGGGRLALLEVKRPGPRSAQALTPAETRFAAVFPVAIVTTPAEALVAVGVTSLERIASCR